MAFLEETLNDGSTMNLFRAGSSLPAGYGERLDARVIEIPWALSRLDEAGGRLLDAGSALNHEIVLRSPSLAGHEVSILTLAPEARSFWKLGVSYHFGDLRDSPFRDEYFDQVVCISTIEHVGLDNRMYTEGKVVESDSSAFLAVVREFRRVMRAGGRLLLTVPFGKYQHHGWFQQFDATLLDRLIAEFAPSSLLERIYLYERSGWQLGDRERAKDREFFDVHRSGHGPHVAPEDGPAAERAVACIELTR